MEQLWSAVRRAAPALVSLGAGLTILLVHQWAVFFPSWSDESIHLYVASRVADGASLYGDIHSARPPLALLPLVLLLRLGTSVLIAARATNVFSYVAMALLVLWFGWRSWGRAAGAAGAFLLLSAPAVASRCAFTGINLVSTWTTAAVLLSVAGRPGLAGLAAGAAIATGQHAAVLGVFAGLVAIGSGLRAAIRFAAGATAVVAVVFCTAYALGGTSLWRDLVGNHFYHLDIQNGTDESRLGWFLATVAGENAHLVLLAAAALIVRSHSTSPTVSFGRWCVRPSTVIGIAAALHVVTLVAMAGGQILYLQPAIPLLACIAGTGSARIGAAVLRASQDIKRRTTEVHYIALALLGILAATLAGWAFSSEAYGHRDSRDYAFFPHVRFAEMASMTRPTVANRIAAQVYDELPNGGTIFGHATIVDLVALETGAKVSADLADLAPRWFKTGAVLREEVVERIEADQVEHFITPAWFYVRDPFFRNYLRRCYNEPTVYPREKGSGIPRILVFRHRRVPRPCLPEAADSR